MQKREQNNYKQGNKEIFIKEFFQWLLERKDLNFEKQIDLSLCREYEDPYIYIPREIKDIFDTKAMQRLKRVGQLGSAILLFENAYHTRYEHSLGVYNRKLELLMDRWQDSNWRRKIEQEGRKEELLAELIKSAAHDIGHLPLSHVMEIQVLGRQGKHEEIGKRILLEDEELKQKYHKISGTFLETMKKVCNPNYNELNLKEQDESNYDIDRLDYLQRDGLYVGQKLELENKPYQLIKVKVDEKRQVLFDIDGSVIQAKEGEDKSQIIIVYEDEALEGIEQVLNYRYNQYKSLYFSKPIQVADHTIGLFGKELLKSEVESGQDLKKFLVDIQSKPIEEINLNEFIKWDDLKFWRQVMEVASSEKQNDRLRELAKLILPDIEVMMKQTYEFLDCKNGRKTRYEGYREEDKEFIRKIRNIFLEKDVLSERMKDKNYFWDNIVFMDEENRIENEKLRDNARKVQVPLSIYKKSEPLYIKAKDGKIYELSKHPDRSQEWDKEKEIISYEYFILPFLDGKQKEQLKEAKKGRPIVKKPNNNMAQIQVQSRMEDYFVI